MKKLILKYELVIAAILALILGILLCNYAFGSSLRCSEDSIICCRILERDGHNPRVAYGEWLGKGKPTDHAQCFTKDEGGIIWWVLVNNKPVKTKQHNFRIEKIFTWQQAVLAWWSPLVALNE